MTKLERIQKQINKIDNDDILTLRDIVDEEISNRNLTTVPFIDRIKKWSIRQLEWNQRDLTEAIDALSSHQYKSIDTKNKISRYLDERIAVSQELQKKRDKSDETFMKIYEENVMKYK